MLGFGVDNPAGEPNGASRSPSGGLAVRRVLHGRIRSGEHEGLMPVVAAHQVRRRSTWSPNLDDLRRLVGRADNPAMYVKPVPNHRVHGYPPQESNLQHARSGTVCGRGTGHPNRTHPGPAAVSAPQTLGHRKWNDDRTQRSQALASVAGSPTGEGPIWDRNRLLSLAVARRSALGTAGIQVAAAAATPPRAPWRCCARHAILNTSPLEPASQD